MGIFNQIFGKNTGKEQEEPQWDKLSPEERFVLRFTSNGGRFLYAPSKDDVIVFLNAILNEENARSYQIRHEDLIPQFGAHVPMQLTPGIQPALPFLSPVEFLIEESGGISLNSNQIGQIAPENLPDITVFIATPGQLVKNIGEAMEKINRRYPKNHYPSNIRSLNHFNQAEKRFYLILNGDFKNV